MKHSSSRKSEAYDGLTLEVLLPGHCTDQIQKKNLSEQPENTTGSKIRNTYKKRQDMRMIDE